MKNMKKSGLFASLLAMAASSGFTFERQMEAAPTLFMKRPTGRSRVPGPRRPAGSKLWRQAEKQRLGMATLR